MTRLEAIAREQGKSVLVLDTATGSGAENFYVQCGGKKPGIPRALIAGKSLLFFCHLFCIQL
jgi:hypothetical protein